MWLKCVLFSVVVCLAVTFTLLAFQAQITTDKQHYSIGEGMIISGTGFSPQVLITLSVLRPDHQTDLVPGVTTDTSGAFSATYTPPLLSGRYNVTATDGANSAATATTAADAIGYNKGVYNKGTIAPNDTTGTWTTGNAGNNYLENQWAYYQYEVTGVGSTVPSFDVVFNHFQSNTSAIFVDALANFRACVDCSENSHTSGPQQGMLLDGVPYPSPGSTVWLNARPALSLINHPYANGTCQVSPDPTDTPSGDHCFHVDGAALAALFPAGTFSTGTHTVTLFYEAHLALSFVWTRGNEALLGCPSSINWVHPGPEVIPANTAYGTDAYGAPVGDDPCSKSDAGDWTSSLFHGDGFATGSSRHFEIDNQTAGSNGGLDLPIPTVPGPTGSITIVKVTNPSVAAGVAFNFSGDLDAFTLDTDPSATNPSSKTFTGLTSGIPYNVTEAATPGWNLTNLVCVDNAGTNSFSYNAATATITLSAIANASVTCTFTNTGIGNLVIRKTTVGGAGSFSFTSTGGLPAPADGSGNFSITTSTANTPVSATFNNATAGNYTVSETIPNGWDLTGRECALTTTGSGTSTFPASGTTQPANITLGAGDTVTCTYTDTKKASLVIQKVSQGGVGAFAFTSTGGLPSPADGSGNFSITTSTAGTAVAATFNNVTPGSFTVNETVPSGWSLTTRVCSLTTTGSGTSTFPASGTTQPANITLGAGDTVTCTYTDAKLAGLIIQKISQGGVGAFAFTSTGGLPSPADGSGNFSITTVTDGTAVAATFNNLTPGNFTVSETVPSGWDLTTLSCSITTSGSGSSTFNTASPPLASLTLGAGDTVTCAFTNTQQGSIKIVKNTVGRRHIQLHK